MDLVAENITPHSAGIDTRRHRRSSANPCSFVMEKSLGHAAVDMLPKAARLGSVEQPFPANIGIGLFSVRVRLIAFS